VIRQAAAGGAASPAPNPGVAANGNMAHAAATARSERTT
jgi:hypothetical protein